MDIGKLEINGYCTYEDGSVYVTHITDVARNYGITANEKKAAQFVLAAVQAHNAGAYTSDSKECAPNYTPPYTGVRIRDSAGTYHEINIAHFIRDIHAVVLRAGGIYVPMHLVTDFAHELVRLHNKRKR